MSQTKPIIVLVPGAWHTADIFSSFTPHLTSAGYKTITVTLPSVGCSPPVKDLQPDSQAVRDAIIPHVENGEDIILFMHSYGAVPACQGIKGLTKLPSSDTKGGTKGGVTHLVFCCAFVLPAGVAVLDPRKGEPETWFQVNEDATIVNPATPMNTFYNDLTPEMAQHLTETCVKPQSFQTFMTKPQYAAWQEEATLPCTYIFTEKDQCVPYAVQKIMVEMSGREFQTETFDMGHSPFVRSPEQIANVVRKAAGEKT
ncbi:hypothetical protein FRC04_005336 [Tulasnella sp. 424]|nr:hypothetical protein FRC04_005336 [Tulasnella sp. 424]KAG8976447.1 hypothetical protein FRC05_003690 [Tulasnella sp. 425]